MAALGKIILLALVSFEVIAAQQCPKNEYYDECGTACPPTCDQQIRPICSKQCVPGCFCQPGFIRDTKTNTCVKSQNCNNARAVRAAQQCPKNEVYDECGSACPATCDQQSRPICSKQCVPGCFCQSGYVRNTKTNTCVQPQTCNSTKAVRAVRILCGGNNEEYLSCGTACPETCDDFGPKPCHMECVSGCFCRDGYVRDPRTFQCVLRERCSKARAARAPICADQNAGHSECGTACPETCDDKEPKMCTLECKVGCFCKSGYVKDPRTNKCVLRERCSKARSARAPICADQNAEHSECGTACPETCDDQEPKTCTMECKVGCFCKAGYVKDTKTNKCVLRKHCSKGRVARQFKAQCGVNQEYNECGSACEQTCKNQAPQACIAMCKQGCFCKAGYLKNAKGECVLRSSPECLRERA